MKITKFLPVFFFAIMLASFAAADAKITYQFFDQNNQPVNNVIIQVYSCKDAQCSSVVKMNEGNTADKGAANDMIVTYPKNLTSQYGYAVYFLKDGYVPIEGTADWHGTGATTINKYFNKVPVCHAAITDFSVVNKVEPNIPLIINIAAQADADTYSAFVPAGIPPLYHPAEFKGLYSAKTDVRLTVYDQLTGNAKYSETKNVDLYMGTNENVQFGWTPDKEGKYNVEIATVVTDDACTSQYSDYARKQLEVLSERPIASCYTLLNDLTVSKVNPVVGETVDVSVSQLSNYADSAGSLSAIGTTATITITDSTGKKVVDGAALSGASYSWATTAPGIYTISVTGIGASCPVATNRQETIQQTITVQSEAAKQANVYFTVADTDSQNYKVPNVVIVVDGKSATTDLAGSAAIIGLPQGTYSFSGTNKYYYDLIGSVVLGLSDVHVTTTMMPKRYNLNVKVVDANGNSVSNAEVKITGPASYAQTTDAAGNTAFGSIHAGLLTVTATQGGNSGVESVDLDQDRSITVKLGTANTLKIMSVACSASVLKGKDQTCTINVINAQGSPEVGVSVQLFDLINNAAYGSATTDVNGNAVIKYPVNSLGAFTVYAVADKVGFISDNDKNPIATYSVVDSLPVEQIAQEVVSNKDAINVQRMEVSNEDVLAGGQFTTTMTIANEELVDLENVKITVSIPDLGVWNSIGPFDIDSGDHTTQSVTIDIPKNAKPGKYFVRYEVKNSKAKATLTRDFIRVK